MADRRLGLGLAAALGALLAACAAPVSVPPRAASPGPADFPHAHYQHLQAQRVPTFRVDSARSLVVISVRRSGSLARLGHDHVVASHDAAGYVAPDTGRADLYLPLDTLVVDEPALRAAAGFDTQPSAADIEGTRHNMLERVLEAGQHPFARVAVTGAVAGDGAQPVRALVSLHGTSRDVDATVRMQVTADEVAVEGTMAIDQSEFGIAPFAILGGAIAVQDRVDIVFRIRARRLR